MFGKARAIRMGVKLLLFKRKKFKKLGQGIVKRKIMILMTQVTRKLPLHSVFFHWRCVWEGGGIG